MVNFKILVPYIKLQTPLFLTRFLLVVKITVRVKIFINS